MSRNSTLLPRKPFPPIKQQCPIFLMSKLSHPPKGKTSPMAHLLPRQLLHIEIGFCNIISHRGFSSMLIIIDAKTRMLWLFCTSDKCPPNRILMYFFSIISKQNKTITTNKVDEDGALACSYEFIELLQQHSITCETTRGYSSLA
jgi:hypothetical protein